MAGCPIPCPSKVWEIGTNKNNAGCTSLCSPPRFQPLAAPPTRDDAAHFLTLRRQILLLQRAANLFQCIILNLPHSLLGHTNYMTYLFERLGLCEQTRRVIPKREPLVNHGLFHFTQACQIANQNILQLVNAIALDIFALRLDEVRTLHRRV